MSTMASQTVEKKKRGPNFQSTESLKLEELVSLNFGIIDSKLTNTVTNKFKSETWESIGSKVSALGFATRTGEDCLTRWNNMKRGSKKATTTEKIERRKTGGGTVKSVAKEQDIRVSELYKECASFNGIHGGIDSDEQDGVHYFTKCSSDVDGDTLLTSTAVYHQTIGEDATTDTTTDTTTDDQQERTIPNTCDLAMEERKASNHQTPGVTDPSTEELSNRKRKATQMKTPLKTKKSRHDTLTDLQIQYFRGQVQKHDLEMEMLEVKLRILKNAEKKVEDARVADLFRLMSED